ncbi:hypothetical protein MIT9_P1870 [Methylomarinovum caldicuralii]|uniref:Smr domain-containing protein n=1 Tax=Methylomarinovum caldicuralii TaxID=438856 RepID=A0AAU9C598_9GAMM|nr:Smr/MutS family protein [Methylomarinovum caldicuralii]BCX82284.1 hypothetical protein MIT9_P1870 [Methylomarinovum caldicuralii]
MNIDDEDIELFRRAVAGIEPLPSGKRRRAVPAAKPAPRRQPPPETGTEAQPTLSLGDTLRYLRPGSDQRLLKRLQQGRIPPRAELDLHGCTRAQAKPLLDHFLAECLADRIRCALIVHGKGWRSPDFKPVLKSALDQWLRRHPQVTAFCSARPKDGGSGALYVLLGQKK